MKFLCDKISFSSPQPKWLEDRRHVLPKPLIFTDIFSKSDDLVDIITVKNGRWDRPKLAYAQAMKLCDLGHYEIDHFKSVLDATYRDIAYAENTLLYERSSNIVQRQLEKASAISSVLHRFMVLVEGPSDALYLKELADHLLDKFSDVIPLTDDLSAGLHPSIQTYDLKVRKEKIRIYRDLLSRGRMLRLFFRRKVRDIRRIFRTLVRTLFKHMNDQSGTDEFWVKSITAHPFFSSLTRFRHGQTRNFSPHRAHYRQSGYF